MKAAVKVFLGLLWQLCAVLAQAPLPLPENPDVACGKQVFLDFTRMYSFCPFENWPVDNPDTLCCQGLAKYFGPSSPEPSRNCFCVPDVWSRLTAKADYHRIPFERVFRFCSHAGHVVPFYQEGLGYCNGTQDDPYAPEDYDAFYVAQTPMPSFSEWLTAMSKYNPLVMTSFVTAIISVPGFLMFLWPFVYEFGIALQMFSQEWANSKQLKAPGSF